MVADAAGRVVILADIAAVSQRHEYQGVSQPGVHHTVSQVQLPAVALDALWAGAAYAPLAQLAAPRRRRCKRPQHQPTVGVAGSSSANDTECIKNMGV